MNTFTEEYFLNHKSIQEEENLKKTLRIAQWNLSKHFKLFHVVLHYVHGLPEDAKILDIWCWRGNLLDTIREIRPDIELHGCDIWDVENFLSEKICFKKIEANSAYPYENESFDMILSTQVIEHMQEPSFLFGELHRLLKPNGIAYVDAPSWRMLFLPGDMNFYLDPTHIRPFTKSSLRILGETNGLEMFDAGHPRNYPVNALLLILLLPLTTIVSLLTWRLTSLVHQGVFLVVWAGIFGAYRKNVRS